MKFLEETLFRREAVSLLEKLEGEEIEIVIQYIHNLIRSRRKDASTVQASK